MTPADLLPVIRRDYLDEESPAVGDPELVARWSREFILREIGEAQRQACLRQDLRHLFDDSTAEITQVSVVANQTSVDLDPRVLRIERATLSDERLQHTTRSKLDDLFPSWESSGAGTALYFWIEGRRMSLWPTPSAPGTLTLAVWRLPLQTPNWNTELEWPGEQEKLAHWVAYRAFLRPNPDTVSAELAKIHLSLFEENFGQANSDRVRSDLLAAPTVLTVLPRTSTRVREECDSWRTQ